MTVSDGGVSVFYCGRGGGVFVVVWLDVGIHVAATDKGALPVGVAERCKEICRGDVPGGEVGGCGGAVGKGAGDTVGVGAGGGREGGEGGFEGEGVGVEPVEESGFAEDAGVGELAGVDVSVWWEALDLWNWGEGFRDGHEDELIALDLA